MSILSGKPRRPQLLAARMRFFCPRVMRVGAGASIGRFFGESLDCALLRPPMNVKHQFVTLWMTTT